MRYVIVSLFGSVIYHFFQVHGFQKSVLGMFAQKSYFTIFVASIRDPDFIPGMNGVINLAIGGVLGLLVAFISYRVKDKKLPTEDDLSF